jgi:hypothetical protein
MLSADTPLYNHPLDAIEAWLRDQGCDRDRTLPHCWRIRRLDWEADLYLDEDRLTVIYLGASDNGSDLQRAFKYSLSRRDVQEAVFSGP